MILPSDSKSKDLLDAANGETDVLAPSSSSSRFAPPNVPPPSYDFARPSTSITPSYYAPVSSTTQDVFSTPGGPPASFARVPPSHLTYPSFQSMFLVATGKTLDKGFPNASPPSNSNPHPFVTHDVKEGDWMRYLSIVIHFECRDLIGHYSFLGEAQMAATLTDKQIMRSHLPIVSIIPIVSELDEGRPFRLLTRFFRFLIIIRRETVHETSKCIESHRLYRQME